MPAREPVEDQASLRADVGHLFERYLAARNATDSLAVAGHAWRLGGQWARKVPRHAVTPFEEEAMQKTIRATWLSIACVIAMAGCASTKPTPKDMTFS